VKAVALIHEGLLKERARTCRGVIRAGEYARYARVILTIGAAF
jgi:D-ribose pyranose/furanose isomerase RbsD